MRVATIGGLSYALVLALAGLLFALVMLGGCGRHPNRPRVPAEDRTLRWVSPTAGQTVAGAIELRVAPPGEGATREVRYFRNGSPLGAAHAEPWSLLWIGPEEGDPTPARFTACALESGVMLGDSASIEVMVEPDRAPRIEVLLPGRALWIEQGRASELVARATDPEEGALPPAACSWTTELGRGTRGGERLPIDELAGGLQRLRVEARDRWGRAGRLEFRLAPFRYREVHSPEDCIWNLAAGLQAMDSAAVSGTWDGSMVLLGCGQGHGETAWSKVELAAAFGAWFRDPRVSRMECIWEIGRAQYLDPEHARHAFVELHEVQRHYVVDAEPALASDRSSGRVVSSREGRMTFELTRVGEAPWRIVVWREEQPRIGPSLSESILGHAGLGRDGIRGLGTTLAAGSPN